MAKGRPAPQVSFAPSSHLAVLPYSSGTTGNPQGCDADASQPGGQRRADPATTRDGRRRRDFGRSTLFHIYGMTVLLNAALHARARLVVMPSFDLGEFLGNIANHKCTIAFIAPPVAVALAKHPLIDEFDLSSLNTVMSGAAPLDADLGHAVAKRLGCRVVQGYGIGELSPSPHHPFRRSPSEHGDGCAAELSWVDGVQRGLQTHPSRHRRRNRRSRRRSQRDRRIVVQGPQCDGRLPRQRRGYRRDHLPDGWLHTGDLVRISTPTAAFTGWWIGSKSSSSTRDIKWLLRNWKVCCLPTPKSAMPRSSPRHTHAAVRRRKLSSW